MVFIVPIEKRRGKLFGFCLLLCTTMLAISLFQFSLSPDQKQSLQETAFWCPMPRGPAPDPSEPLKNSSVSSISPPIKPSPRTLKLDPPICSVPSNNSVLCLLTIQMDCPEMSGNARGYLFWFPSTVYAPFPWLSVGYLGYGQERQWTGWELGWIPWEAVEQGLVVSRMSYSSAWLTTPWPPWLSSQCPVQDSKSSTYMPLFWLFPNWWYKFISLLTTKLQNPLKQWPYIILCCVQHSSDHTESHTSAYLGRYMPKRVLFCFFGIWNKLSIWYSISGFVEK